LKLTSEINVSVEVQSLSKNYGLQKAVDAISFSASPGSILGFLGPNGAGKSTTMKILTCFIPQTSGSATVCGFDVTENPLEVRRNIGYLPEHNPLYVDMYVKESLSFMADIHQIENKQQRIAEVIELTGLGDEQHKKIGALSKGYRQRVGLAQAILHDPKVLILDEPTSGLDPNQIIGIRNLIKELGKTKTVILSTHIMQEVEAICEQVIIIGKGKIVADDKLANLKNKFNGNSLEEIFISLTNSSLPAI
jgi:ABC-2 type transport system ATP-binding protein